MKKNRKYLSIISIIIILLIISKNISPQNTKASDDVINENAEFVYYIDVYRNYSLNENEQVWQSDLDLLNLNNDLTKSDYIFVEDKLPIGLEFKGFITSVDGSIGAYKASFDSNDNTQMFTCDGFVVDDTLDNNILEGTWNNAHTEYTYHGLHYNDETRKITFTVDDLSLGCALTVGVIVETPALEPGQTRLDFYNIAQLINSKYFEFSDVVHHILGDENEQIYNVNFVNEEDFEILSLSYPAGTEVSTILAPKYYGLNFDGWTSDDVTITDNKFIMPSQDIEVKANYSEATSYSVTFSIDGTIPEDFEIPSTIIAYPGEVIKYPIKEGDIVNGYEFQGWETTGVTFGDEEKFVMPSTNVTLTGSFEEKEYTITYKFEDNVVPPNAESLLPAPQSYKEGEVVTLPVIEDVQYGWSNYYIFYGWKSENNFKMPKKDLIIYGTWVDGLIERPEITLSRLDNTYVKPGDDVLMHVNINLRYASSEEIDNLYYIKLNTNLKYIYDSETDTKIPIENGILYRTIDSKETICTSQNPITCYNFYDSFDVIYHVGEDERETTTATIEIENIGISTNEIIRLNKTGNYTSNVEMNIIPRFMLCSKNTEYVTPISNIPNPNSPSVSTLVPSYKITGGSGVEINVSLEQGCAVYFLYPGNYMVKQALPFHYKNTSISGITTTDNTQFTLDGINDYYLIYVNEYKDIEQELSYFYTNRSWVSASIIVNDITKPCNYQINDDPIDVNL